MQAESIESSDVQADGGSDEAVCGRAEAAQPDTTTAEQVLDSLCQSSTGSVDDLFLCV